MTHVIHGIAVRLRFDFVGPLDDGWVGEDQMHHLRVLSSDELERHGSLALTLKKVTPLSPAAPACCALRCPRPLSLLLIL